MQGPLSVGRLQVAGLVAGRAWTAEGQLYATGAARCLPSKEFLNRRLRLGRLDLDYWRSGNIFDKTPR
jgi:hypothetical protein